MKSRTTALVEQGANVVDALANVLAPVAVLEQRLRCFAHTLRDDDGGSARRPNTPRSPQPTVEFNNLDEARAERALARLGVRRTR